MQNVQRWSQPCWTSTKARARPSKPWIRCGAVSRACMMSVTWMAASASAPVTKRPRSIFSVLPSTPSTSGMAPNLAGSSCAAQPVTMSRAFGLSRRARRIVWRAWRSASAVTAQVLMMTASLRPAARPCSRIISDSNALSRQPSVMT